MNMINLSLALQARTGLENSILNFQVSLVGFKHSKQISLYIFNDVFFVAIMCSLLLTAEKRRQRFFAINNFHKCPLSRAHGFGLVNKYEI